MADVLASNIARNPQAILDSAALYTIMIDACSQVASSKDQAVIDWVKLNATYRNDVLAGKWDGVFKDSFIKDKPKAFLKAILGQDFKEEEKKKRGRKKKSDTTTTTTTVKKDSPKKKEKKKEKELSVKMVCLTLSLVYY